MGWIVGVSIFIGSLLLYRETRTNKIQRQREEIEVLKGQLEQVKKEKQLQQKVDKIKEKTAKKVQQIQEEHEDLEAGIPEPEESKELSDEAKQSAAAISSHSVDRYHKRLQDRT